MVALHCDAFKGAAGCGLRPIPRNSQAFSHGDLSAGPDHLAMPEQALADRPRWTASGPDPVVEIALPVYNEEADLEPSVVRLRRYLDERFPLPTLVTIADNASTDATWERAGALAAGLNGVRAVHLSRKGRGRALKAVWSTSQAPVVAYMDVDLSTSLEALLPLVAPLLSGHADVAIGSRLATGARVVRGAKREFISRSYNVLLQAVLGCGFSDAQCGFKAVRTDMARRLIPAVRDDEWFFDTELLVLAERSGLRVHEVAVDWIEDADSRVDLRRTAVSDLRGVWRIFWHRQRLDLISRAGVPVTANPAAAGRTWP